MGEEEGVKGWTRAVGRYDGWRRVDGRSAYRWAPLRRTGAFQLASSHPESKGGRQFRNQGLPPLAHPLHTLAVLHASQTHLERRLPRVIVPQRGRQLQQHGHQARHPRAQQAQPRVVGRLDEQRQPKRNQLREEKGE